MALCVITFLYILAGICGKAQSQMSTIVPYNTSDNGTVDCIHGNDTYIMNCSSPTSPPDMTTAMPNLPPKLTEGPWCYHCSGDRKKCLSVDHLKAGDKGKIPCDFPSGKSCISMANRSEVGADINFITRTCTERFDFMCTDRSGRVWANDGLAEMVCCAKSGCNTDVFLNSSPSIMLLNLRVIFIVVTISSVIVYHQ